MTKLPQDTDFAVLGGGMAGLQVAVSLSRSLKGSGQNAHSRGAPRPTKMTELSAFGMCQRPLVAPAIAHRWSKWRVKQTEVLTLLHQTATNTCVYLVRRFISMRIKELDASEEVTLVTST